MILKIIAMGFVTRQHSYLRDPWNILDFFVVIAGWVGALMSGTDVSAIRTIRIMRPLRTINSVPGMSRLVSTIINSLPMMFDVMVLFIFMIIMFAAIVTQLLMGKLNKRCFYQNSAGNYTLQLLRENEMMCSNDQMCNNRMPANSTVKLTCRRYKNPIAETYSFDNCLWSIMNIFQIITLEGWTDMMYLVREAEGGSYFYDPLFIFIVLFGAYFVINLMVAVQYTYLSEAFDEDERNDKEREEKLTLKQKQAEMNEYSSSSGEDYFDQDAEQEEEGNEEEQNRNKQMTSNPSSQQAEEKDKKKKRDKHPLCCCAWCKESKRMKDIRKATRHVVMSETFETIIIWLILINTLFLATEHYDQVGWLSKTQEIGNLIFTIVFGLEMVVKIFALGFESYLSENFNIFDSIVVIVSFVELASSNEGGGLSVFRAFRLLRIFKIVRSWKDLRTLLMTVISSFGSMANLGILTALFLFMMALLMKQFYGSKPLKDFDGEESRYDFRTTIQSMITMFIVLTGENWNEIMIECISAHRAQTAWTAILFILTMLIGNYMILNLFLAILLKFISQQEDSNDAEPSDENQKDGDKDEKKDELSSNSNIDDEVEQIKVLMKQLSKYNQSKKQQSADQQENIAAYEGGAKKHSKKKSKEQNDESQRSKVQRLAAEKKNYEEDGEDYGSEEEDVNQPSSRSKVSKRASKTKNFKEDIEEQKNQHNLNKSLGLSSDSKAREDAAQDQIEEIKNTDPALTSLKHIFNKQKEKERDNLEPHYSLCCISDKNLLRTFLYQVMESSQFKSFIYLLIAVNTLMLILDEPRLSHPYQKQSIAFILDVISVCFIVECVIKIIVLGFFWEGKNCYLHDPWNILDFILVLFSIVIWILASSNLTQLDAVRGIRALRALRPLRVVAKDDGIKAVVNSLINSLPSLLNVVLIIIMFLLVFGILGVQLFKGALGYCSDPSPLIMNKSQCVTFVNKSAGALPVKANSTSKNLTYPTIVREWKTPFNNYDNVIRSMITFFEISTLEMWPGMMFAAIDSRGVDLTPSKNYNIGFCLIFITFIFVTSFFIMNLFISVIVDKFNEEIEKREGSDAFNQEQKEWVKIQRILVHTDPKITPVKPDQCFRKLCFKIADHPYFDPFVMSAIIMNTVFLLIEHYDQPETLSKVTQIANQIFVVVFLLEMLIKIIGYGIIYYWHVNWNKFDCILVLLSLVSIDERLLQQLNLNVTALRIMRVSRLFRMVKTLEGLRSLMKTLYLSISNIMVTFTLLLLILIVFSVAGMQLFGKLKLNEGEFLSDNVNFQTFPDAIITLWRACTGESWNGIMHEVYEQVGVISIFYWVIFELWTFFIFMNVFIAVICENFRDIQAKEDEDDILSLKKQDIKAFQYTWARINKEGQFYMKTLELPRFLRELPPPLGYDGIRIEDSKLNKIIFCLNIRDHKGQVYYPEVMWAIFHSVVGVNDNDVNNCKPVKDILKILAQKYRDLGKNVKLDALCGNKYFKNELTAIKYIQAKKILTKWQAFKEKKKDMEQKNFGDDIPPPNSAPVKTKEIDNQTEEIDINQKRIEAFGNKKQRQKLTRRWHGDEDQQSDGGRGTERTPEK